MADGPARVLLVDDDEDDFVIVRDFFDELEKGRFALEWAPSFDQGVARLKEHRQDVVLSDYHLGARTGVELIREARAIGSRAPIILLTGQGDRSIDMEAMQAGAEDYLDKGQLNAALLERSVRYAVERRRAEERFARSNADRERLHRLFSQAPAMINIQSGPDHVFDLVHPLTRKLLGRDVTGLPVREAVPELAGQGFFELLDSVYQTGVAVTVKEKPALLPQPDGTQQEVFLDFTYQPWMDSAGRIAGVMTFAVEVTAQVLARKAAEAHVSVLKKVEAELQSAVNLRDEFLTIASHELRTPLTPLQLQIEGLQRAVRKLNDGPDERVRFGQRLEMAARQLKRLTALVDNLLDVSRISGGKLELHVEELDLAELARDLAERFRPEAEAAPCRLVLELQPARGRWDRVRIEQVLSNLLSNAIKYGRGSPVVVSTSSSEGAVRFSVRDNGIGIEPADQQRIFGRFERAVPTRNYGGLGLGLYIAAQLVEAHGGSLEVESEPGKGSTFTVVLPVSAG